MCAVRNPDKTPASAWDPPEIAFAVNLDELGGDAALLAELVNGATAVGPSSLAVVVDDHIAARRDLVVECCQSIHRRLIVVAIEAEHGEPVDRRGGERVLEPADQ